MSDKIYIGNGKEKRFDDGGSIIKMSFSPKDLETMNAWANNDGNGWVNISVSKRKQPSDKGVTHYGILDTWKPKKTEEDRIPF